MLYDFSINNLGVIEMEKIIKLTDESVLKVGLVGNQNLEQSCSQLLKNLYMGKMLKL